MPSRFPRHIQLHHPARCTLMVAATYSVLLLVVGPQAARGDADCIDYAGHSRWVASLAMTGGAQCVGVEGDLACVGEVLFEAGPLLTVDIHDLRAPAILGELESWEVGGIPFAVVVSGGLAYLLAGTSPTREHRGSPARSPSPEGHARSR